MADAKLVRVHSSSKEICDAMRGKQLPLDAELPVTCRQFPCKPLKASCFGWGSGNLLVEIPFVFVCEHGYWFDSLNHRSCMVEVSGLNALLSIRAAIILLGKRVKASVYPLAVVGNAVKLRDGQIPSDH